MNEIRLTVDWWATIGRWGTRYGTAAACWAVGIMAILMWDVMRSVEAGGESLKSVQQLDVRSHLFLQAPIPDVRSSLDFFARKRLSPLVLLSFFLSFLPLRVGLWLGNGGSAPFAPLATLLLPIAFGLVCVMWWLLLILLWPLQRVLRLFSRYVP